MPDHDLQDMEKDSAKATRYSQLLPRLEALVDGEPDFTAVAGNLMAALKEELNFLWIGLYRVAPALDPARNGETELVLGPFQGPVACNRIGFGKGVCGTCWQRREAVIVPDVDAFPGHIACSSRSRSEIVLPLFKRNEIVMVLDVDSEQPAAFDETDRKYLQKVVALIEERL